MVVNPFWLGVLMTVVTLETLFIGALLISSMSKKLDNPPDK